MSRYRLLAAATIFSAMAAALPANSAAAECSGELTVQMLATADCAARIPVPSPRPEMRAEQEASAESVEKEWTYVETPGAAPGETRRVRLVGTRFLPDPDEKIDFGARAALHVGPLSALVNRTAAYLTDATAKAEAVAQASEPEPEIAQEARLALELSRLRD